MENLSKILYQKTGYIFRLDDVAPHMKWDMMEMVKNLFNKYNVKPILGIIPNNKDKDLKKYPLCKFDFWSEIKSYQNQGWEIAMHGYEHLYDKYCKKIDYLGHGGNSEFVGHAYELQLQKLNSGLDIFKQQNLQPKVFFAPNHTFDQNTISACKTVGFESIIDGYGINPYYENEILFIPQLFYKLYVLPIGIQTIQLHINFMSKEDFIQLEKFIKKNKNKIISYSGAKKLARNNGIDKIVRFFLKKILILKRTLI